jgi:hypothetical protein
MSYQEIHGGRMNPEQSTDRWLRWGIRAGKGVLVLLAFVGIMAGFKRPMEEQNAMRAKVDGLKRESEALREDRDKMLRRLSWIQTDEGYLEMEVRDRLNLQKSGEYVLRFED